MSWLNMPIVSLLAAQTAANPDWRARSVFGVNPNAVVSPTTSSPINLKDSHDAGNTQKPTVTPKSAPTTTSTPTSTSTPKPSVSKPRKPVTTYQPNAPARMAPKSSTSDVGGGNNAGTVYMVIDGNAEPAESTPFIENPMAGDDSYSYSETPYWVNPQSMAQGVAAAQTANGQTPAPVAQADTSGANNQMIVRNGANPDTPYAAIQQQMQAADPNYLAVMRSAGASPDTSYGAVNDIMAGQQADAAAQAAAENAAMEQRYQQLLDMYGIAPGSGKPVVNQQAAQDYYNDPTKYNALASVFGW